MRSRSMRMARFGRMRLLVVAFVIVARSAAAITVTTSTDDGPGSLRQALVDAADGEIIDFALATPATIRLTSGELLLAKSVTIVGPGSGALMIDGNASFRVFHVAPGKIVTILRLTATNGKTDDGGGCIVNEGGALTLDHVVVRQ